VETIFPIGLSFDISKVKVEPTAVPDYRTRVCNRADHKLKDNDMFINTAIDVISTPFGTARLLEGHSTLQRAANAKLTYDQMREIYTDIADCPDEEINGFIKIGRRLVAGQARFKGQAFDSSPDSGSLLACG
jgi:hypothetical protein